MEREFPKPQSITIIYDQRLRFITGRPAEECVVSEGAPFSFLLSSVLESHPQIKERYPPGVLGFTVNGEPPEMDTILKEGDIVRFLVVLNRHN